MSRGLREASGGTVKANGWLCLGGASLGLAEPPGHGSQNIKKNLYVLRTLLFGHVLELCEPVCMRCALMRSHFDSRHSQHPTQWSSVRESSVIGPGCCMPCKRRLIGTGAGCRQMAGTTHRSVILMKLIFIASSATEKPTTVTSTHSPTLSS